MEWGDGRHFVTSFINGSDTYNLWVQKYAGDPAYIWQFHLSKGDWQVSSPADLWSALTDQTKIPNWPNSTQEDILGVLKTTVVDPLNAVLVATFGSAPVPPATIQERIEAAIMRLVFFRDASNIPQIRMG
jgi:hypothetical protein